jgi:hypothetical protein
VLVVGGTLDAIRPPPRVEALACEIGAARHLLLPTDCAAGQALEILTVADLLAARRLNACRAGSGDCGVSSPLQRPRA